MNTAISRTTKGVSTKTFTVSVHTTLNWSCYVEGVGTTRYDPSMGGPRPFITRSSFQLKDPSGNVLISKEGFEVHLDNVVRGQSYSGSIHVTSTGTYTLVINVAGKGGNVSGNGSVNWIEDSTPPTITYDITERDWDSSEVSVNLTFSDNSTGVVTKQYAWTQSTTTPNSWTNHISNPVIKSENGEWYLHTRAIDGAGNVTTECKGLYRIDGLTPTIAFSIQNRDWSDSTVSVDLTFADSGGSKLATKQYAWTTDKTTVPSSWNDWSSNPVTLEVDTANEWYLYARAVDNAGNELVTYRGPYRFRFIKVYRSGIYVTVIDIQKWEGNDWVDIPVYTYDAVEGFKQKK